MKQTLLLLIALVLVGGLALYWYTNQTTTEEPAPVTTETPNDSIESETRTYTGLTEAEAEAFATQNNVAFRVVERDGEPLMVTEDFVVARINASVSEGVVTSFTVEGEGMSESDGMNDADMITPEPAEAGTHDEIIGMTEAEAEAYAESQGVSFRASMRGGLPLPLSMDYRPGRITAEIEGGVVTSYTVE